MNMFEAQYCEGDRKMDFNEIVRKARGGDTHAFALLYNEIYKDLYYTSICNLNNEDDAADAVSETVLDAFRSLGKLKSIEAFRSWMYRILTAKIKRKQKEYAEKRSCEVGEEALDNMPSSDEFSNLEITQQLMILSDDQRLCFTLGAVNGYSSKEIANITGMKESTIRSHIMRGREKLRKLYK